MIKSLLRNIFIYVVSLIILPRVVFGVSILGGFQTITIGAIALTLMFTLLKPILNVLTFPFNLMTMGLFSVITNTVILYLLTVFVPNITIHSFGFPGMSVLGFSVSPLTFNTFFAFIAASVVLSITSGLIRWLIK